MVKELSERKLDHSPRVWTFSFSHVALKTNIAIMWIISIITVALLFENDSAQKRIDIQVMLAWV